jgi:AcrR family transcriptional regulator
MSLNRTEQAIGDWRSRRYSEKQRAILRAATATFNRDGIRGANLSTIARTVGLTTTSITYYYRRKEELVAACYLHGIESFNELNRVAADLVGPNERLSALTAMHFQCWQDVVLGSRDRHMTFDEIRSLAEPHLTKVGKAYVDMFRGLRRLLYPRDFPIPLSALERNARTHLVLGCLLWLPAWITQLDVSDYAFEATHFSGLLARGLAEPGWRPNACAAVTISVPVESQREAFLRAATHLINEHGYHGASVDKISARLSVSKGSFYHHNETKDELVVACFERTFAVIREAQSKARALPLQGIDRLRAACAALVEYQMSENAPLLRSTALLTLPKAERGEIIARMNRLSTRFADMVTDGIIDGSIQRINARTAGQLVNPMINGAAELSHWVPDVSRETVTKVYVDPLLTGITSVGASRPA